jgi:hypothetical protein
MLPVPERFHAGGGDLLRQIGGRNDRLGEAHVVVGHEDDLEPVPHRRSRLIARATSQASLMMSFARW